MEHGFALIKNEFRIAAGQRVIKGPEYRTRVEADVLIDSARQAAARIVAEADLRYQATVEKCRQVQAEMDNTYHDAVEEGYKAGFAGAQRDYAAEINDALIERAEIIDQLEYSLVDMLVDSLKTILGDMGADRSLRGIAINALHKAGRAQFARLRVHPDRVESVQHVIQGIKHEFEGLEWIEVVADTNLQPEDCLLQTPAGILDFSLDTQLRILKESLRARVRKAGAP
jgi:type III secretion system HrpE/YscL family protein